MRAYPRANNQTERNLKAFLVRLQVAVSFEVHLSPSETPTLERSP
jgi:hypothetical protein